MKIVQSAACLRQRVLKMMILLSAVGLMEGCATADANQSGGPETVAESIAARYPAGTIQSVEVADQALAEVRTEGEEIQRGFAAEERA